MSKRQVLMVLGIWVIVFLFLGFPSSWDKVFAILTGLIIVAITVSLRPEQPIQRPQVSQQPQQPLQQPQQPNSTTKPVDITTNSNQQ